ncbi:MAG: rhomboid family intramembrane serine protease [Cellvibrionaceae bacterium]
MPDKSYKKVLKNVRVLAVVAAILFAIHVINVITGNYLLAYGILPRQLSYLPNILFAPFLHGSWAHLLNNLTGLIIFGGLCLLRSKQFFIYSSLYIIVVGGCLVWMFGRPLIHIGASGWVFGLWAVCICSAFIEKSFLSVVIAFFVIAFYGGMIYGLLPSSPGISFESHLFGALAGFLSLVYRFKWIKYFLKNK